MTQQRGDTAGHPPEAQPGHDGPARGRPEQGDARRRARFFQLSPDLLAVVDAGGRLLDHNGAWAACLGLDGTALAGASLAELALPEDAPLVRRELALLAGGAGPVSFDARFRAAGGEQRCLRWSLSRDEDGGPIHVVGRDITAERRAEAALAESERRFRHIMATAPDAIAVVDLAARRLLFFNREELCGYGREELGAAILTKVYGEDRQALRGHLRRIATSPPGASGFDAVEYRLWRRDGGLEWIHSRAVVLSRDEGGSPRQVIFTLTLITERKHSEQMLDYQAHYDPVTGLPNRFLFADRLEERIAAARERGERFAICFVDLDRFNQINDSLGHTAGDDVLSLVAERLRRALSPDDLLARMGGDEFTLILARVGTAEEAMRAAQRLLVALEEPIAIEGHELFVSASVGISLYPLDGADATTLLKHADSAMYRAKAAGRNGVSWFEPELGRATVARLELGNQLRRAIDQQQFALHYQPQVDLASGRVVGVEALIRWHHPERGVIGPGEFIPLAEESHLMARISAWVIHEACRQAAEWDRQGRAPLRVAVNLSARLFERDDVVQRAAAALRRAGLAPRRLDLELTESVLMRDPEGSALRIERLRALGARVSLDDFGTGYSSLSYLQRFPLDALKIDRSFVRALAGEGRAGGGPTALVRAIVALAHSLGLAVVAEGVETRSQRATLRLLGCDEAQGYLFGEPLPPEELWARVAAINAGRPSGIIPAADP